MNRLFFSIVMFITLPILLIQSRLLLYKRSKNYTILADLLETVPHELSVMGFTLAMASLILKIDLAGALNRTSQIIQIFFFIPFIFIAIIPITEKKVVRLILGIVAYITGAALFYYVTQVRIV